MKLLKKEKAEKIQIIISSKWKYELYKEFNKAFEKNKTPSEITREIMKTDLKSHGQEIVKLVPKLIENKQKIILTQDKELKIFKKHETDIEKEFNADLKIEIAENSKEDKAKNAMPGKPAIIIK